MKEILELIEKRTQEFVELPLFQFMQDKSIDPKRRLSWVPCAAPLIVPFGELNRFDFRREPTEDKLQQLINRRTYEDDYHWVWFLEDLAKLGFNQPMSFSEAMYFFWSDGTQKTRQVCHQIALHSFKAEPIVVLAGMEAIEATGRAALEKTAAVTRELGQITNLEYRYFGQNHLGVETGHTTEIDEGEIILESLELTDEQRKKAIEMVELVFRVFTDAVNEMMVYLQTHSSDHPFKAIQHDRVLAAIA